MRTVRIPKHIQPVSGPEMARLLEKQWRARIALKRNPFARAMNIKWQLYYRSSIVTPFVPRSAR